MPASINNKNSGLCFDVSRVRNYLKSRADNMRISQEFVYDATIYLNFIISQCYYTTMKRMRDDTPRGSDAPKRKTITREDLFKTLKTFSLFSDLNRHAAPIGRLQVKDVVRFPSAERLKSMNPYQRTKFFHTFNYKNEIFKVDEDYFDVLADDEEEEDTGDGNEVEDDEEEDEEQDEEQDEEEDEEEDEDEDEEEEEDEVSTDDTPSPTAKKRSRSDKTDAAVSRQPAKRIRR